MTYSFSLALTTRAICTILSHSFFDSRPAFISDRTYVPCSITHISAAIAERRSFAAKWTVLTSRHFCEFSAIEQKQHDLIPRAAAIAILLFGAAGFTAYIGGGKVNSPDPTAAAKIRPLKSESTQRDVNSQPARSARSDAAASTAANLDQPSSSSGNANTKQRAAQRNSSTEAVYYCGAMTKKGTACTRRVKSPGRCWQHLGQPAASSPQN